MNLFFFLLSQILSPPKILTFSPESPCIMTSVIPGLVLQLGIIFKCILENCGVPWIHVADSSEQWCAVVNKGMNFCFP
jgi:hypothetical protein